jgi:hypothetical protein
MRIILTNFSRRMILTEFHTASGKFTITACDSLRVSSGIAPHLSL